MARIGTVGYLNARPLSDQVDLNRHTLVLAHPAEVARMLRDGEVDVALVPVAAVLQDGGYKVVPGWCVGSAGPVASVVLVGATPPEEWTRVVLDGVSRTSVVLAQLLLKHGPLASRVRPDLEVVVAAPNTALAQVRKGTAALVIGDLARTVEHPHRVDLATEWREWTGLPFVFAVWAGRADLDPAVVRHLADAGRAGVADLPTRYANGDLRYLTENLRYPLDDAALSGLRRFAALAHRAGLLAGEDFELYGPDGRRERPDVDALLVRVLDGGALPPADVLALVRHAPVADLAAAADLKRRSWFPGDTVPYRLEAVLAADEAPDAARAAVAAGASRIRLDGPADAERVAAVAAAFPGVAIEADAAVPGVAVLGEDPGGTWSERVRAAAGLPPLGAWRVAAERASRAGVPVAASLVVGRGETEEEWVGTLLQLAELPGLAEVRVWAAEGAGPYGSVANTATDHLRAVALARLVLPGSVRVLASPETEGLGMLQASLRAGCDHAGALVLSGDPAGWAARIAALEEHAAAAGLRAVREGGPRTRAAEAAAPAARA